MASISDVAGILVGHTTDVKALTGCTVVLAPPEGMRGAVHVRGRATGTRELDALSPRHLVPVVHAILLTGGSAYGLGAADGVMRWLSERGRGFQVGVGVVPIVPAAVVFDLAFGDATWPSDDDGYSACDSAGTIFAEGSVGAGAGATVGKVLGLDGAMKGGVGSWSVTRGDVVVGALAVVNSFGDVRDSVGGILAGARRGGEFLDGRRFLADGGFPGGSFTRTGANTTLVVVATNGDLSRLQLQGMAEMAADSLAQRITPVGTQFDGDIVFATSIASVAVPSPVGVELMAQEATAAAIERAVTTAVGTESVPGIAGP